MMKRLLLFFCLVVSPLWGGETDPAAILTPLLDPQMLDVLKGDRAANSRLRRMMFWLETARNDGNDPEAVIRKAQRDAGYAGSPRADADRESLLRNRTILERLGCLDAAGMASLRKGTSPRITRGPYAGDVVEVDHIIPRALTPELDERLYNLEFMPSRLNQQKAASIGVRQRQLAERWRKAGLLSEAGLRAVMGLEFARER